MTISAIVPRLTRAWPQPVVGGLTATLAILALGTAWARAGLSPGPLAVAVALAAAVAAAYHYPIHLRLRVKVSLASIPYCLMVVLLPPPLAALSAATGALAAELSVRVRRGLLPSDIAAEVGRRTVLVLAAAALARATAPVPLHLGLVAAALLLGAGDILTYPLVMARDAAPPWRIIRDAARDAWAIEGVQYLMGLAAALAAGREAWALAGFVVPGALVYRSFKRSTEMQDSARLLFERLADTVDLRDPYTGGHSRRVTTYCARLLDALGIEGAEVDLILAAARIHDIGKIGVPDAILHKPGKLIAEEWALMETHPVLGADLLARQGDMGRGVDIVRHHHEAWDGTGYPAGLTGLDIPFGARVIAVADSYDAMTSDRPYRQGMPPAKAVSILRAGRGRQWEAVLVDAFLRALDTEAEADGAFAGPPPTTTTLPTGPTTEGAARPVNVVDAPEREARRLPA